MGCSIFTRKARELIFHNKIQQSSINFTRFRISSGSNRSTDKIIVAGIGKVTQLSIFLRHRDKQAIQHTSTQKASEEDERKRGEEKENFSKVLLEVGERKTRGEWRIM